MRPLGFPISLDRPRSLLLDEKALHLCAHTFGISLDPASIMTTELTLELVRDLIWCGCVVTDRKLRYETVCQCVRADNYMTFHEPVAKAVLRGLGISYQPS